MSGPLQALPSRALLAICALSLLASACITITSEAPSASPSNAGDGTAIPLASAAGPVSADPITPFGTYDQAFFDDLVERGWTEPEALTLALTKLTEISADERNAHITAEFPTGDTADIAIALSPGLANYTGTPTMTSAETAAGFMYTVAYHVSSIASRVDSGSAAIPLGGPLAWLGGNGPALDAGVVAADDGGADVAVTAIISEGQENLLDAYIDFLDKRYPAAVVERLGGLVQVLKSAGSLADALALNVKYKALQARITAAEECARNPTNPLTVDAYRADPGMRDRLLEDAAATRRSVKANAAAVFLSMLNAGIAELTKQVWLDFVLSAGNAWATENFDKDNEERVRQLEASITKCHPYTAKLEVDIRIAATERYGNLFTAVAHGTIPLKVVRVPESTTGEMQLTGLEGADLTWTTTPGAVVECGDPVISGAGIVRGLVVSGTLNAAQAETHIAFAIDPTSLTEKTTVPRCDSTPPFEITGFITPGYFLGGHLDHMHPNGGIDITGWTFAPADPTTGVIQARRTYVERCDGLCNDGESTFTLTLTPVR